MIVAVKELQNLLFSLYCRAAFIRKKRTNSYRFCTHFPIQLLTLELYLLFGSFYAWDNFMQQCVISRLWTHTLVPLFSFHIRRAVSFALLHLLPFLPFFLC
jgi:hypothetical protein